MRVVDNLQLKIDTNLSEYGGELAVVEVRNGGDAGTVLGEFPQSTFELVESRQTKQVHLLAGRFL